MIMFELEIRTAFPIKVGQRIVFVRFHVGWGGKEAFFIRVWKPLPSRHVLKTLKGSPEGKTQKGQYLQVVDLGYYKWYQS